MSEEDLAEEDKLFGSEWLNLVTMNTQYDLFRHQCRYFKLDWAHHSTIITYAWMREWSDPLGFTPWR